MLEIIKSFFSPVGGGRTSFASQNGNQSRKEDLRQEYNNSSSNSDFNRKRGGSVLNLPSFASENIVGGGQLRSTKVNASSRSYKGKRAYAHFKGGEGNYASLMSSDFAGTETMLTNSDTGSVSFWDVDFSSRPLSGGGEKQYSPLYYRKGASRLSVLVAQACSLLMDASRMTSVLIHEMISLSRREVQA